VNHARPHSFASTSVQFMSTTTNAAVMDACASAGEDGWMAPIYDDASLSGPVAGAAVGGVG